MFKQEKIHTALYGFMTTK
jgi:G2/mitotic-specific cyclin-B, other